jgi:hypothetical protein
MGVGWVVSWLESPSPREPVFLGVGLFIAGIVLLALEAILSRLRYIEFLIVNSPAAGKGRIKTGLGEFELLDNVEGEATCIGCKRTVPKAGLYHSRSLDVYYHPACLARDCTR